MRGGPERGRRAREFIFWAATLVAGITAAALAAHWRWGVPGEWQWQPRTMTGGAPLTGARWWMPIAPGIALIALSLWLMRRARRRVRVRATWALLFVLVALLLQHATLAIAPRPPASMFAGAVILSPVATTYFTEAGKVTDVRAFLADYANRMRTFSQHAQTYPPGPIVFFWLARKAATASAAAQAVLAVVITAAAELTPRDIALTYSVLFRRPVGPDEAAAAILSAWLLGFLGCLSVLPIYLLARDRWGDGAAVAAAALSAALPSLILFTPSILQLVTWETALVLYLFHRAWSRGSIGWAAAAGAMWGIAALTSLEVFALLLLLGVWAVGERWAPRAQQPAPPPDAAGGQDAARSGEHALQVAAASVVGAVVVLAVAYLALGINFPAIVRSALGAHRAVTTRAFARTYSRWLGWNLFDFWMFLGAGLGLWLLRQMVDELRGIAQRRAAGTPLLWAAAITIAVLDLSGVVRAEVGRIWMFLMLPAAAVTGDCVSRVQRPELALAVLLAAQLVQLCGFERYLALFVLL